MDGAQNVVLIGGPGTGKPHVATAIGIKAIEHHRRKVRFFSTIELVNALEQESSDGTEAEGDLAFIAAAREALAEGYTVYYDSWW